MGVKMNVGTVLSELDSMNRYLSDVWMKSGTLGKAFRSFEGEAGLQSAAYDNHKSYIGQVHQPVADGIAGFCSEMIEANDAYGGCLRQYFSDGMVVDEDKWKSEHEALKGHYDQLNSTLTYIIETIRSMVSMGRPGAVYTDMSGYQRIANSYREELETLYEIIEEYRENIEKIGEMLIATSGIYEGAQRMQKVLASAISAMSCVGYDGATNEYVIVPVNLQLFAKIEKERQEILIAKVLNKQLGDELLGEEEFMALDAEEQLEYADKVAKLIGKYIPNLSVQMLDGEMRIPLADGLVLYGGVAKSIGTDLENPHSVDVAISKNREILADWGVKIGNLEGKKSISGAGIKRSFNLDSKSTAYTEITLSRKDKSGKIEWGATTTYEEINSVTSKIGLEFHRTKQDWEESLMEDYELEITDVPKEVLELQGILLPYPVGVPVPAI
ncbi:LXG domain-containing protein [Extibacter muris]|uniref:LXG domain-containing protein n=1 Tax=Extibacter muris TaxID=1796622 RepID=UPI001D06AE67|nr:LXG domain-containing protein [Extibacter muris]MCB6202403.1 LXG domain-containing protein [Extibacter muris]MCQ4665333.1 LXG domain-containing protein [Extibacter muris]MCQ4694702.1 LXG domain-containing protein [Extibacter muris]